MSFSAGVFSINSTGQPVVTGTVISSTVFNALTADLATGLSTCVLKDGTQTCTGAVPFALGLSADALVDLSNAAAGQIKFPATQNSSTNANTLDDYEEGTWTPTDASGATLTFTSVRGDYVKIGQLVCAFAKFTYPTTVDASAAIIGGLPFTILSQTSMAQGQVAWFNTAKTPLITLNAGLTTASWYQSGGGAPALANSDLSAGTFQIAMIYRATA